MHKGAVKIMDQLRQTEQMNQPTTPDLTNWYIGEIVTKTLITGDLMIIRVQLPNTPMPAFRPGQFAVLGLPPSALRSPLATPEDSPSNNNKPPAIIQRAYSIASSSHNHEYLEFYITMVRSGALTPRLFNLNPGDNVYIRKKFSGLFTLDAVPENVNLVLAATGTGVAPYMSMVRSRIQNLTQRKFAIIHGARSSSDLGYHHELFNLGRMSTNFAYLPVISRPQQESTPWNGHSGYIQDLWQTKIISNLWREEISPTNTHILLCGNPSMIEKMLELLEAQGFRENSKKVPGQIHVEKFWQ